MIVRNNYNLLFKEQIDVVRFGENKKKLLIHSCCAPCSSHVLELLSKDFDIWIYFYNPNITEEDEYIKRYEEVKKFINQAEFCKTVKCVDGGFEPKLFIEMAKGKEDIPEGGSRCRECYYIRMEKSAIYCKENNFDYFTTTLSISPYKNSQWINEIGEELADKYCINFLYSDFKKENGYKRSIELSKEYNLYRQDYCGCIFSKKNKII